jgi:DNA-binding CsgD family transcriptional regulator
MVATLSLPPALDAIGHTVLAPTLLSQLGSTVGAEHCVLFHFGEDDVGVLGFASADGSEMARHNSARYRSEFWRRDSTYTDLKSRLCGYKAAVSCLAAEQISDQRFRRELILDQGLAGRALIVGERGGRLYGLSMFRGRATGFFSEDDRASINAMSDLLVSMVAKHAETLSQRISMSQLLSSVAGLEAAFRAASARLSERECQVCARIVYGMAMKEIARDLGITPESAVTYRKRAFLRLDVLDRGALLRRLLQ